MSTAWEWPSEEQWQQKVDQWLPTDDDQVYVKSLMVPCHEHGKTPGMGGVYAPDAMKQYIDMGMRLLLTGSEFSFMMAGAKAQSTAVRALK